MASITSLMNSSSTSSIYGTRNVLSGLASGMDTETMIENAVSGIKKKIQTLIQKRTKVEWQQEAYRSIIDKAVNLGNKYTSYSSKTNLLSSSFFSNAVINTTNGTYASKVTATGRTSSDIKINAVKQMATAASYSVSGSAALGGDFSAITSDKKVNLSAGMDVSRISGSLTLQYGGTNGTSFSLSFDELDIYNDANDLAEAIREKLGEQTWTYTKNGMQETVRGSDVIDVQVDSLGIITFSDKTSGGNSVYISSVSGDIEDTLGVDTGSNVNSLMVGSRSLASWTSTGEYLSDKSMTFNLNGTSKTIKMSDIFDEIGSSASTEDFVNALQTKLNDAFGSGKVNVSQNENGALSFEAVEKGSTLALSGSAVKALGFEAGDANYINTSKTLKDLLGEDSELLANNRLRGTFNTYDGTPTEKTTSNGVTYYVDDAGNRVDKDGYRITDTGELIYQFEINGVQINATEDTTLASLMTSINSNADAGVKVSYSTLTNEFKFTATETGANGKIEFGGLAKDLFNPSSGIKSTDSFSDAYGLNADEGNRNISFPIPGDPWGERYSFNITSDMTRDDIVKGLTKLFEEKGLNYRAGYDDNDQLVIVDQDNEDQQIETTISKRVSFEVPGVASTSFEVTSDMTMEDIVKELNESMFGAFGYTASYDEESGQIIMKDGDKLLDLKITNENGTVTNEDGEEIKSELKTSAVSGTYTAGTDAIMDVEINGVRFENLTRSSNSFDLDGLTINVKDTFGEYDEDGNLITEDKDGNSIEPVTFTTTTDTETIINAIRNFVNDYNEMITELKSAYSTQPSYDSSGDRYEPLTSDDEEGMTESEIAAYNEKAKQGILFGDTTLSSFYSKLLNAIAPGGTDGQTLREIGIGTSYSDGLTTISLDEDKLRTALESNPDKVKDAFTKTADSGSTSNGLMQNLQNTLNTYVKTTGEPKGVLITRAGSVKSPTSLSNNTLNTQINNIDKQIERWQNKMSDQIDRYTSQFSRLEQLMASMESQYSAMSSLMGGTSGY